MLFRYLGLTPRLGARVVLARVAAPALACASVPSLVPPAEAARPRAASGATPLPRWREPSKAWERTTFRRPWPSSPSGSTAGAWRRPFEAPRSRRRTPNLTACGCLKHAESQVTGVGVQLALKNPTLPLRYVARHHASSCYAARTSACGAAGVQHRVRTCADDEAFHTTGCRARVAGNSWSPETALPMTGN